MLLALAGALSAQTPGGLTSDSPFLPAGGAAAAGPAENATLEFRGMMVRNGEEVFCLVDTSTPAKKSVWIKTNETGRDFIVKSYDPASDTLTVDNRGRILQITLLKPKVGSSGAPMAIASGHMGGQPQPGAPIAPVVLNPTPADEAKRLEAFATEVRRRRQLREQSMQQQQQPPQQQPVGTPQPQPPGVNAN
ncbi:MAG: hypothetical protein HZA31_09185 [Opitutae bacterium]|nr:hypothetical protein [Opitutae bacterium]